MKFASIIRDLSQMAGRTITERAIAKFAMLVGCRAGQLRLAGRTPRN